MDALRRATDVPGRALPSASLSLELNLRRFMPLWDRFNAHYEPGFKISQGGEGIIYKCRRHTDQKLLAVKFLPKRINKNAPPHEADVIQTFLQPPSAFVVPFVDCIWDPQYESSALIFQFCNAGSLLDIIESIDANLQYMPESFIWYVFRSLAEALFYIHRKGVIHRDIKPENVLLHWVNGYRNNTIYPMVYLSDFGLAIDDRHPEYHKMSALHGTLAFMPPEAPLSGPPADVWSLGATMHEMMFNMKPFPLGFGCRWTTRLCDLCQPDQEAPVSYIQETRVYSVELQDFIRYCLAWKPNLRITANVLRNDMAAIHPRWMGADFEPLPFIATPMPDM